MRGVLIAGCGFVGEAAADLFLQAGWEVVAITRSASSARALRQRMGGTGAEIIHGDLACPSWLAKRFARRRPPDAIIHCASSGGGGEAAYHRVYLEGMRALRRTFPRIPILFTSSTSVYACADGSWVDESSPVRGEHPTAHILLEAERLALDSGGWVARLAGIYGPGRCYHLRALRDGTALLESGRDRWINQIHRDDGAKALFHLAGNRRAMGIYNVSDGHPLRRRELYAQLARALSLPLPPEGPPDTAARKPRGGNKRVCNDRLRATGWSPRFPSIISAIRALCLETDAESGEEREQSRPPQRAVRMPHSSCA